MKLLKNPLTAIILLLIVSIGYNIYITGVLNRKITVLYTLVQNTQEEVDLSELEKKIDQLDEKANNIEGIIDEVKLSLSYIESDVSSIKRRVPY